MNPKEHTIIGDFHLHTKEYHPSTEMSDYMLLIQAAMVWHLQAIAITDHNSIDSNLWATLTDVLPDSSPIVFPGVEMTTMFKKPALGFSFKGKPTVTFSEDVPFHLGIFGIRATDIKKLTSQFQKPPHDFMSVISVLDDRDLMVTINHPMIPRKPDTTTRLAILQHVGDMDKNHTVRAIEYSTGRYGIGDIAHTYGWAMVAGSDAHVGKKLWEKDIGSVGTEIVFHSKSSERSPQEIYHRMMTAGAHMLDEKKPGVVPVIRQPDGNYRKFE